jgi:hypothetical protein
MALISDFIQTNKITELATALISRKLVLTDVSDVRMGFKGSEAQIPVLNSGTIGNYVAGADMTVTNVSSSKITIALDQSKYINDYLDDVDDASSAQSALPQLLNTMTNGLGVTVEQYGLSQMWATAGIAGTSATLGVSGTPITIDKDNIDDYLVLIDQKLTEADAPDDGRFVIITPTMQSALTLNNIYIAASTDEMARSRGYRGMYGNLAVYVSNSLPAIGAGKGIVAGVKGAFSLLFNYEKFRNIPAEDRFGTKYQAVSNYGAGANTPAWILKGVVTA